MAVKKQEPDKFQQEFHSDIHTKNQGKLKIFLGYAEGTGKRMRCFKLHIRLRNKALM